MKTIFLFLFFLISIAAISQEASLRIVTQDSWPPGRSVPVTIEIVRGNAEGFARLFHDLPQGFTVENVQSGGAEFFVDNNQINYVWVDLPEDEIITIQYLARADVLLTGSFKIGGRLDYILKGKERVSKNAESQLIRLDQDATVDAVDLPEEKIRVNREVVDLQSEKVSKELVEEITEEPEIQDIDFRVQVSISSSRFSQAELEDRIGSKLKHGITVLKTGNMFKYQSGSFKNYQEASVYLKELKTGGVKDAFIVAFRNNIQISINEARSLTEK